MIRPSTPSVPSSLGTPPPRRALWLLGLYGILSLFVVPVYPHFPSPNELSRWALAVSIVERGSFEVGPLTHLIGNRIEDFALFDGRLYSNKAPGGSLAAVPAYALARTMVGPPDSDNLRETITAMRLGICTIPLLLLGLAFIGHARRAGIAPERIAFALAAMLFGTPLFAYGLLLFSHALTAAALFGAWLLLFGDSRPRQPRHELAAGALIGLAAISEYPAAVPGTVLAICALRGRGLAGGLRLAAGAFPLLVALALYDHAAFGSAFALSSSFERVADFRELSRSGLWGVGLPSPAIALRLLLDPSKGLLVFSPVLVLALAAIPAARRSLDSAAFWSLVLAPLTLVLVYAGYSNWHGGWTVGARYLVPAMPFLAYLLLWGRPRILDPLLLGASAGAVGLTALVFPFVSEAYAFPWASFATPLLVKGLVAPNLLHLVSRTAAVTIPFAIVIVALFLALDPRRAWLTATGLAVWTLVGFFCVATWFPDGDGSRWTIEEIYFEQLDVPRKLPIEPGLLRRLQEARRMPPSSWPF